MTHRFLGSLKGGNAVQSTPRKRIWVDSTVQGAMLWRLIAYWCFYMAAIAQLLLCWQIFEGPAGPFWSHFRYDLLWNQYESGVIASALLLPLVLYDVLLFSHRFTGPVFRLRRCMKQLAAGETVQPVKFRKNDYRPEMADEFNAVLAYVARLKEQIARGVSDQESQGEGVCYLGCNPLLDAKASATRRSASCKPWNRSPRPKSELTPKFSGRMLSSALILHLFSSNLMFAQSHFYREIKPIVVGVIIQEVRP